MDDVQELKPLVDIVIDNFGIGKELGMLINGVKNRIIEKSQYEGQDIQKLRLELIAFLRFWVHIGVTEVPFLK